MTKSIFPIAYLPPISYFAEIQKYSCIYIDVHENYIKQSIRNRCHILSANGPLRLSIPVIKTLGNHTPVNEIKIDYAMRWNVNHLRAIESAYSSSPFFIHYFDDIKRTIEGKPEYLVNLDLSLMQLCFKWLKTDTDIKLTENYSPSIEQTDYHRYFSKFNLNNSFSRKYRQVFSEKFDFVPDLSILDLLFNEGKYAADYIREI